MLEAGERTLGKEHPATLVSLDYLAGMLEAKGDYAGAEPLYRRVLEARKANFEKKIPDSWQMFDAQSLLGGCLLGQKKVAEAEPLLLSGYEGMKQREDKIPVPGKPRLKEALQRLVQLYEATGRTDQAAAWKQKLAELEKPNPRSSPPR